MKKVVLTLSLVLGSCFACVSFAETKTEMIALNERVFGPKLLPVEVSIPDTGKGPFPLIIYQHGSSRDGHTFEGSVGKTDEHGTRLKKAALAQGFAFAALDAFHDKGLAPSDKTKFPKAEQYANQLRSSLLVRFAQLDPKNTFYSGFSYGGDAVMNQLYAHKIQSGRLLWRQSHRAMWLPSPDPFHIPCSFSRAHKVITTRSHVSW